MPLPENVLYGLPSQVVNELAILEDRALRAEGQLANSVRRVTEMEDEISKLRDEIALLFQLGVEVQEAAQRLAACNVEQRLRRFLVVQAG
jgi:hypothetical protein